MRTLSSIQWLLIAALLVASVLATAWMIFYGGTEQFVAGFWRSYEWVQANRSTALLLFFLLSFASQLIVMPSGSLMLLLAGFALGGIPAALVFAIAQVLSAWPVYSLSSRALKTVDQGFSRGTDQNRVNAIMNKLASLRGNQLVATALLRLTPVIPSAGACLLAAMCGIQLKPFLAGTLLTCWIRPLFFASSGAAMSSVLLKRDVGGALGGLDVTPLMLVFVSAVVLFLVTRKFSR